MSSNPSFNRPDQAKASFNGERSSEQPNIGMVSLGCPKALVDSERILQGSVRKDMVFPPTTWEQMLS